MEIKWHTANLKDMIEINPKEFLPKGTIAKKISMDMLQPFRRDIQKYELSEFTGGTKFRNGDTIMARITPCLENGKTAKVSILESDEVGFGSTEYIVFRAIKGVTDADFVYYLICSPIVREPAIKSMVGSSGRQRVQTNVLEKLVINFPNFEIQRKIGCFLRSIDDKIELNNKINENLEQQAQALFKAWFVDFEPFGGVMPENWEKKSLGEISEMSAGGDKPKNATEIPTTENTVPIYSNGISNEGLYGFTDKAKIVEESVTVSARGTIGYVCLRQTPYVPIVRLITIIPRTSIVSAKYIYLHLKTMNISGTGTTQQQLTVPNFKSTELSIPNITVINKFTSIVNPMFEKIKDNKIENQRLASLRDTLLPKLMNGEIDVSEVQI